MIFFLRIDGYFLFAILDLKKNEKLEYFYLTH